MADFSDIQRQLDEYLQQLSQLDFDEILPRLPDASDIIQDHTKIQQLIFETSNVYRSAAFWLGAARGRLNALQVQYDREMKRHRTGNNTAQRDSNAVEQTDDLARRVQACKQEVALLSGLVDAAENASQSARKIAHYTQQTESGYTAIDNSGYTDASEIQSDFDDDF